MLWACHHRDLSMILCDPFAINTLSLSTVRHLQELVGQEVLYKLTSENCEHFVNELRYGVPRSDQVGPQCAPVSTFSADAGISVDLAGVETGAQTRQESRDRTVLKNIIVRVGTGVR